MNNFLQALGQGLRGWGATTSQENFNTYNQQNQFREQQRQAQEQQKQKGKELALGLIVQGIQNGAIDENTGREAIRRLQIPGFGENIPPVGLSLDAQRLMEEKRQFNIETEEARKNRERIGGIVGGLLGGQQQSVATQPAPAQPINAQGTPTSGKMFTPSVGSEPMIAGIDNGAPAAQNDVSPPEVAGLETNYGTPQASQAVQQAAQELQTRIPGVDPKRAYEAAIVISQLGDKDTGQRVKDFAEYLSKNKEDQRKWEREQITIDDFSIGKDHDLDREFFINEDGSKRWLSTDEANKIRNKGREASAPKVTVNPENIFDKEGGLLRAKSLADQESLTKKYIHIAGEVGGLTEAMRGMEGGAPAEIASWLGRFFPNSSIGDYKSADEMISSLATRLATQVRAEGSGQTSNFEMSMYLQAIPRLATTEAGRELMKIISDRFAERKAQEYDIYLDMVQESYASGKKGYVSMEEYKKRTNALGHLITEEERDIAIKAAKDKNYRYRQIPTVKEGGNRRNGPVATPSKEQ